MRKVVKYSLRILGGLILGILLLVLLLFLLIQTRPGKNMIAGIAENQTSNFINGNLKIGELGGNFFTHLSLTDVLLTYEDDTLAHITEVDLRYNLLSLLDGTVDVHSARIDNPYIFLEQLDDSTWNVQKLMKPGEQEPDTSTSESMNINLTSFIINEGRINISSPDTIIPAYINNLNTELSLIMADNSTTVNLDHFSLITEDPDIHLKQLSLVFEMDEEKAELGQFVLETAQNIIEGSAQYQMGPIESGSAQFKTGRLQIEEFAYFLPDINIQAAPIITLKGDMKQDSVTVAINLEDKNQSISATVFSDNITEFLFRDTTAILNYTLQTTLKNIDPGYWSGNPDIDYVINGNLNIRGHGIDPKEANIIVHANLDESTIEDQNFSNISANLELNKGNLWGVIQGEGGFGDFHLAPDIKNLLGEPVYSIIFTANELNLAALTGNDTLQSNINMSAELEGKSFDPEQIAANGEVLIFSSSFQDLYLDTLLARINYANENIHIDSLWLQTQTLTAEASGNYSLNSNSDVHLIVNFDGLSEFESFVPVENLSTRGQLKAHIAGMADSLQLEASLMLDSTSYDTITFTGMEMLVNGKLTTTDTLFDASVFISSLDLGGFVLDSVSAQADGSLDSVFLQAKLVNQDLYTQLQAGIVPGDKLAITIPGWDISYKNQHWSLQGPPAYIELDSANYFIDNFRLATDDSDSAQYLSVQGTIRRFGDEDFSLEAGNIQIDQITEMMEIDVEGSGSIDLVMNLSGTSESPLLDGSLEIRDAEFNEYSFTTFRNNLNFNENILRFESLIVPQDSGRFEITAELPLQLNLDTMGYHFSSEDSLSAQVLIQEFSLGILNTFNIPVQTTGFIEGNVNVGGTLDSPDPEGSVRLVDASFAMQEFGIDYRDVRLNLSFLRDRVELDTFYIRTDDGDLRGTGMVNFGSDFYEGDISDSKVVLNFNGFNPINHPQFNMQVDGMAELTGQADSLVFGGDLRIPQAEFYLPAIFQLMGRMTTKEMPKPLLVRELESTTLSLDSMGIMEFEKEVPDSVSINYLDQLKGQLRVRIPRNTWIKNDDMRIEISGELEVIKNADFFELFGEVDVIRGQYEMLGRVFVIDEGTVNFEGGEEMNLKMDISASYTFRNNQQMQQELTVNITGTIEEPEVNFELDGNAIEEGDALSYIIFGKSMDELTLNEQNNMENSGVGSLAQQAAASLISAQLTSFLQDKLDVDYIEVKAGGSFDEASVTVGKYLTNKLFVSYEQRFGHTDELNPRKYEVKLEYELFRFLFFELNNSTIDSGFNLIFKSDIL